MIDYTKFHPIETDIYFERVTSTTFRLTRSKEEPNNTSIVAEDPLSGLIDADSIPLSEEIQTAFNEYKSSPVYQVGLPVATQNKTLSDLIDIYETLIAGICLSVRTNKQFAMKRIDSILSWLRNTDFYRSPASTAYHGSFEGGLLVHSLDVYNQIVSLKSLPQFNDVSFTSAALVALTHDWCKIGLYECYDKNVKNQQTGQWEQIKAFKRNQTGIPLGHGAASMFLVMRFFPNLTPEEACAIRWHQSRWNVCREEMDEIQHANEIYPLVHLVQFADQLSITQYATQKI